MFIGAIVGFSLFAGATVLRLWQLGCLDSVPMFTPPPGLAIMVMGCLGGIIGSLASLFSRKWNSTYHESEQ